MVKRYASGLPSTGERPLRTKRKNVSCATSGASSKDGACRRQYASTSS